jgi:hypothetical protein
MDHEAHNKIVALVPSDKVTRRALGKRGKSNEIDRGYN